MSSLETPRGTLRAPSRLGRSAGAKPPTSCDHGRRQGNAVSSVKMSGEVDMHKHEAARQSEK
eukprot:1889758-Pleurochrysis_carterae.AAC.1